MKYIALLGGKMNNSTKQDEKIECINKEIEAQLLTEMQNEESRDKKGFLTAKFWVTLTLVILMLSSIVKLFM